MRHSSKNSIPKLSADSQRLITFSEAIIEASSRVEERAWQHSLDTLLQKLLKNDHQNTIDAALDKLSASESNTYDVLMESVGAVSESTIVEHEGIRYDALLIAAPILAWTRFSIASGSISPEVMTTLSGSLQTHVLAPGARLAIIPMLFAIDQLPPNHVETFTITQKLAQAALKATPLRQPANIPETAPFLADTRYLLAVVLVPMGTPIFQWQTSMHLNDRSDALKQWKDLATPIITRLLPGCGIELLLPEAYYIACRKADKQIRPTSIRAAVHYLTHTLDIEANALHAFIGSFGEKMEGNIDEYRIGFSIHKNKDIVHGVVWPLYGPEDEEESTDTSAGITSSLKTGDLNEPQTSIQEIMALLLECGVTHIKHHSERFAMEFCEDCGAPLYPDVKAELMHAELPDDIPPGTGHLH
jgi:Protein of unknown function (DUF2863)